MKQIYFIIVCFLTGTTMNAQSNITFSVDMTGQTFTQAYVSGSFNAWSGTANPLTDMGGGIWEATLPITDGEYEYKFTYDDWTGQDTFTQGDICTITNYGNTNRRLVVEGSDQTLATAPFNDCAESASNPGPHNVTFTIDVNGYAGAFLGDGVTINGEWNSWCGLCNPLVDQGGGIWSVTLPLDEKSYQFKFTMGNWSDQEAFSPGDPQTATDGTYTNRYIQVDQDKSVSYIWNQPEKVLGTNDFNVTDFSVYPNPTRDKWNIKTQDQDISSIHLFDMLGKQVMVLKPNSTTAAVDVTKLTQGLYFAQIKTESGVSSIKLIKK